MIFPQLFTVTYFAIHGFIFIAVYGIVWHRIYPPFDDMRNWHNYDLSKGKEIAYLQAVSFFYQKRKVKADSHLKKAQKHKNFHETKKTYAQT